ASYSTSNFSPDSWATAFSEDGNLAFTVLSAQTLPLPTELGGTTVEVTDAAGVSRLAQLLYVSPKQVNFLIPTNSVFGLAIVKVTNGQGSTISSIILITHTSVGIYSANASGQGVGAANLIRVTSGGQQSVQGVANYDSNSQQMVPLPIDFGA